MCIQEAYLGNWQLGKFKLEDPQRRIFEKKDVMGYPSSDGSLGCIYQFHVCKSLFGNPSVDNDYAMIYPKKGLNN